MENVSRLNPRGAYTHVRSEFSGRRREEYFESEITSMYVNDYRFDRAYVIRYMYACLLDENHRKAQRKCGVNIIIDVFLNTDVR